MWSLGVRTAEPVTLKASESSIWLKCSTDKKNLRACLKAGI